VPTTLPPDFRIITSNFFCEKDIEKKMRDKAARRKK
jgi:hypothetical protein